MELSTLDVTADEARDKLAEYRGAAERTAEDEAILAGYRAAASGKPLISLSSAITAGGYFGSGLPHIAVIRAGIQQAWCWWDRDDLIFADRTDWRVNRGALVGPRAVRVTPSQRPSIRPRLWDGARSAIVPIIPPASRPLLRRLSGYHILWEVEEWGHVPPRDPALLRHIRGDLWAVHSTWDLTELERHVLSQRARP